MRAAQSGIFAPGTGSHSYLEFDLLESEIPSEVTDFDQYVRGVHGYSVLATQHGLRHR
jgi:hypothetical protein